MAHPIGGFEFRVAVRGRSMLPTLRPGDVAVLDRPRRPPRVGEVWVAWFGRRPVMHRVVRAAPHGVVLRGDANARSERAVLPSRLFARVAAVERSGRGSRPHRRRVSGPATHAAVVAARALRRARAAISRLRRPRR